MKITFFKNEWETFIPPEMSIDVSWQEVADMLTTFIKTQKKEDTEMYNLWEFEVKDGAIHRCAEDCIALHGLVLDYDQNLSLVDALQNFDGMECVIYTTFNHGVVGKDKYRVVLPFTHSMPAGEFKKKRAAMIDTFRGVDRASFSRSQAIFLHSGPNADNAFSTHLKGNKLDWTAFEDEEVIEYDVSKPTLSSNIDPAFQAAYKNAVITALSGCSGIRHMNSMSLAIILKSCGASFDDYRMIVSVAGAKDSCIQESKTQSETWNAVADDVKIGREKRDSYIVKFGGQPVVVKKSVVLENKIEKLKRELGYVAQN